MAINLLRKDPWNGDSLQVVTYYGYGTPGIQEYDNTWSIKRKSVINGVLKYEYPYDTITGGFFFSGLIWANRTSYTYSEVIGDVWDDNRLWDDNDIWID